jgi:methionyl-tRNA formyltransferase
MKTDSHNLRIIFLGTPDFAVASLDRLVVEGYNVVGVVTAPDRPAGRGLKMVESSVKKYAVTAGIPLFQPEKLRDETFLDELRSLRPDLGIVIAFRMLPQVVWSMPRLGTFNLHASLLPQYRGAAPINRTIMNGETETGVTTFFLNSEIDKGGIIAQVKMAILPEDNAGTMHDKLMERGALLVRDTVDWIAAGGVEPIAQSDANERELKAAPKIFREDCRIDWRANGHDIVNLIRGLSPQPGAWSMLRKGDGTDVGSVKFFDGVFTPAEHTFAPGTIDATEGEKMKVTCSDGWIASSEVQQAGKRRMTAAEMLRGMERTEEYRYI